MTITALEIKERLNNNENLTIIDVREPWEFEEARIPGAINIPLATIPQQIDELQNFADQEVILQCRSGARSATAQQLLISRGFSNTKNLTGGILAWLELNK